MPTDLSTPIAITTASGRPDEERVRAHLLDLFDRYSLDRWRYTEEARIEAGVIPHSHPILTLNTQYGDDPAHLLADYIHEQLHWFTLLADSPHDLDDDDLLARLLALNLERARGTNVAVLSACVEEHAADD